MRKVQERSSPAAWMHEIAERVVKPGSALYAVGALLFYCTDFGSNTSGGLTGSLEGCVVNRLNNSPLQGAEVLLVGDSAMSVTDANGVFRLSGIVSGTQMLIVKKTHFVSQDAAVLVQTNARSRTDTIRLSADFGILTGLVRDTISGSPVQGANVLLYGVSDTTVYDSAVTDRNGFFIFDTVSMIDSGFRIVVDKQGYGRSSVARKIGRGDSIFVSASLRQSMTKALLVYDADTKTPINLAMVQHSGNVTQSDVQGRAEVTVADAPDSGCLFQVWAVDYDTVSFRDPIEGGAAVDSLPLQRQRGCLAGTVRCQGKLNHAGAVVRLSDVASDTTDSPGNFFFADVRAGTYPITATREDFVAWTGTVDISGNDTATDSAVLVIAAGTIEDTVVWDAEGSPYRIDGTLTVGEGGILIAQAGTEIRLAGGARLSTNGNGVFRSTGTAWNLVRIGADGEGEIAALVEIRGYPGSTTMSYTQMENVAMILRDGPVVEHCLFVFTGEYSSDTTVYVDVSDYGTSFNQCDFIRIGTDAPGVFVRDSLYTADEEGGEVAFRNCIFSRYSGAATGTPFVISDNSGNVIVRLTNCNAYADGNGVDPPFDVVHGDTSSVWRMDPGYFDAGRGDYSLGRESVLLDKSTTGDCLGALGVKQQHLTDGEP